MDPWVSLDPPMPAGAGARARDGEPGGARELVTGALADRLESARLADRRLETQRERAADALGSVVEAMGSVVDAARDGNPVAAEAASTRFSTAVGELRSLPAGS